MIDFNDPRAASVAEVISNKSCKKILSLLASSEFSESELASKSGLPVSTVNYSMKKLVASGLVEKTRHLISSKGKSVPMYRVSEKHIVISPKTLVRGTLPAIFVGAALALGLKFWGDYSVKAVNDAGGNEVAKFATTQVQDISSGVVTSTIVNSSNAWAWFFIGTLIAVLVVLLWNWSKR